MKAKSFVVVLAMLVAALSFSTGTPPCAGGVFQNTYTIRTCENPTQCSVLLTFNTYDQTCEVWCCPGGSTPIYNNCANRTTNGCCRERTDLGPPFPNPQIIYDDPTKPHVLCTGGSTEP